MIISVKISSIIKNVLCLQTYKNFIEFINFLRIVFKICLFYTLNAEQYYFYSNIWEAEKVEINIKTNED